MLLPPHTHALPTEHRNQSQAILHRLHHPVWHQCRAATWLHSVRWRRVVCVFACKAYTHASLVTGPRPSCTHTVATTLCPLTTSPDATAQANRLPTLLELCKPSCKSVRRAVQCIFSHQACHTHPFCSYIMLAFIHTLLMSAFLVRIYVMWAIIARYFQKFTVRSLGHALYGMHAFGVQP